MAVGGIYLSLSLLLSCIIETSGVLHAFHCIVYFLYALFIKNDTKTISINNRIIKLPHKYGDLFFPIFSIFQSVVNTHLSDYTWTPFFIYALFGYKLHRFKLLYFGSLWATYVYYRPTAPFVLLNLCTVTFFDGSRRRIAFLLASFIHLPFAVVAWEVPTQWEAFVIAFLIAVSKAQFLISDAYCNVALLSVCAFSTVPFLNMPASILCIAGMVQCISFFWWHVKWRESDFILYNPNSIYLLCVAIFAVSWRQFIITSTA